MPPESPSNTKVGKTISIHVLASDNQCHCRTVSRENHVFLLVTNYCATFFESSRKSWVMVTRDNDAEPCCLCSDDSVAANALLRLLRIEAMAR
jgi:hypothetical protein